MGRYFDENYELLGEKLDAMAHRVQGMIEQTIEALTNRDVALAGQLIELDEEIDKSEIEIDELVMRLLALQQPMAVDLRFLITALKINNDLERMGDQAVNIAQGVLMMSKRGQTGMIIDFEQMEDAVQEMVRGCIEAFTRRDAELARKVRERDDEVDEMNRSLIGQLAEHLRTHPEDADSCMTLLLITRNLERIGDLSTNVAEDVVYYIEGQIIKHSH